MTFDRYYRLKKQLALCLRYAVEPGKSRWVDGNATEIPPGLHYEVTCQVSGLRLPNYGLARSEARLKV